MSHVVVFKVFAQFSVPPEKFARSLSLSLYEVVPREDYEHAAIVSTQCHNENLFHIVYHLYVY